MEIKQTKKNLQNSKIYKLLDTVNDHFYIGSTTNQLSKRLYEHKRASMKAPQRKVYKYFNSIGWDNVKIILIENISVQNRQELIREEYKVIEKFKDEPLCLNSRMPPCTCRFCDKLA